MQRDVEFEDLEEGEVSDGDDDEKKPSPEDIELVDYEVLPRPVKGSLQPSSLVEAYSSATAGSSRTMGVQMGMRPNRPGPGGGGDDGDYDQSSSSLDSDDDEDGPSRRKCKRMPSSAFVPSNTHTPSTTFPFSFGQPPPQWGVGGVGGAVGDNCAFRNQASVFQEKRKPNNVWSQVLQDEEVSDIFGKVNVEEYDDHHVLIDRGPETFSVKYKHRPAARQRSCSSSLSSGGLTDNELEYLRGTSFEETQSGQKEEGEEEGGEGGGSGVQGFVTRLGRRTLKRPFDTKIRRKRRKRKNQIENKMKRMPSNELGRYMADKLNEPKHHLLIDAIELLGKEACIALFLKTTKIERRGGLMVMNQQRRRTPGGVFFYLLRGDHKFPKDLVDQLFAKDKQHQIKARKKVHKLGRLQRLAILEKKKAKHETKSKQEENQGDATVSGSVAVEENKEGMNQDLDDDNVLSDYEDGESEGIDSDEFCGTGAPQEPFPLPDKRQMVGYDDQDCLDIHCDENDFDVM